MIAAAPNARTDGGFQIARTGAKILPHFADALFNDALNGSAPAGVKDSDRVALGIHQDYRKAIGGKNRQQDTRGKGDQSVSGERVFGCVCDTMNDVGVNLAAGH